jgi:hypothetical protein
MDKIAQGFARKIIDDLGVIRRLIHDAVSHPRQDTDGPEQNKNRSEGCDQEQRFVTETAMPTEKTAKVQPTESQENNPRTKNGDLDNSFPRLRKYKPVIEFAGVITLLGYTGVTVCLLISSREANRIAKDSSRPYVGVDGFTVMYIGHDSKGAPITRNLPTEETTQMGFAVSIKNFGTVPASNVRTSWKIFLNGVEVVVEHKLPDTPSTQFPGQSVGLTGTVGRRDYPAVISGEKPLAAEVTISYEWPGHSHTECNRNQYAAGYTGSAFWNLGACISK